jgi:hypothetical protein
LTHDPQLFFITRWHQAHLVHHIRFENRGALTTIPARQIIGGMGEEFIFILFFVDTFQAGQNLYPHIGLNEFLRDSSPLMIVLHVLNPSFNHTINKVISTLHGRALLTASLF